MLQTPTTATQKTTEKTAPASNPTLESLAARIDAVENRCRRAERRLRVAAVVAAFGTVATLALGGVSAATAASDDIYTLVKNLTTRVTALEAKTQDLSRLSTDPLTGKPTLVVSGVNLQIVNGSGTTNSVNGVGNLIVGYNESRVGSSLPTYWTVSSFAGQDDRRTGSHNLIVGSGNNYTSYGSAAVGSVASLYAPQGVAFGRWNTVNAPYSTITGGEGSATFGSAASISGGIYHFASGEDSSITGGYANGTTSSATSVNGGKWNWVQGDSSVISGGLGRTTPQDGVGNWAAGSLFQPW